MNQQPQREVTTLPHTDYPVAPENFDTGRPAAIDKIIIHTEVGFKAGTEATFNNPQAHVSAHYGVNQDGSVDAYVREKDTAWHAGNLFVNQSSIGIEHEDLNKPNDPRPDILYTKSAELVHEICHFYNIPIDRGHILKHIEVSLAGTSCPDTLDVDRIVREAAAIGTPPIQSDVAGTQPVSLQDKYDAIQHLFLSVCTTLGVQSIDNRDEMATQAIQVVNGLLSIKTTEVQSIVDFKDKLQAKQEEVDKLFNENIQLKASESQAHTQAASYLGQLQAWEKKDSTAIDSGIIASKELDALKQDWLHLASVLKVKYKAFPSLASMLTEIDALMSAKSTLLSQFKQPFDYISTLLGKNKVQRG